MTVRWMPTEVTLGVQSFSLTPDTTQRHDLGAIIKAKMTNLSSSDTDQGAGEFIYLLGCASDFEGAVVSYNATTFQTVLAPNTANLDTPLAVAMGAVGATKFGWYQISGIAKIKKTAVAVAPQVALFLSGTIGRVKSTATSGKQVVNAKSANLATIASGTSTVLVLIQRPFAQGQVI